MSYVLTMVLVFYGINGNPVATTTVQSGHSTQEICKVALQANIESIGNKAEIAMATCNPH